MIKLFTPLQEAARRYTDTSWHIFNQNRKKINAQLKKNSNGNTYQKLESTDEIHSPSPVSDLSNGSAAKSSDTSSKSRETSPNSGEVTPTPKDMNRRSNQNESATSENESASSILYEKIGKPESKQIVKIETVEVTYEPVRSSIQKKMVSVQS